MSVAWSGLVEGISATTVLKRELERIHSTSVHVGYWAEENATITMIAGVQEFGCAINVTPKMRAWLAFHGLRLKKSTQVIRIPETAFLRRGLNAYVNDTFPGQFAAEMVAVVTQRRTAEMVGNRVGLALVSAIQEAIDKTAGPPLHPFTLSRRAKGRSFGTAFVTPGGGSSGGGGSPQRLRDTGRLRSAVTYRVEIGRR
jgi:uncharacterized membrane protein YgcG